MSQPHDPCEVFLDARGNGRALRLTWHHETDVVVLSLWREGVCAGTFRLPKSQVNDFIDALVDGLHDEAPPGGDREIIETQPSFLSWAFDNPAGRHVAAG